jgi:hypothetical protein
LISKKSVSGFLLPANNEMGPLLSGFVAKITPFRVQIRNNSNNDGYTYADNKEYRFNAINTSAIFNVSTINYLWEVATGV